MLNFKSSWSPPFPDYIILCTTDAVGLYLNLTHDERLIAWKTSLESREDKATSTDSLMDLAECILKNNIFEHMVLPYAIFLWEAWK